MKPSMNPLYQELGFSNVGAINTSNQDTTISRILQCLPAGLPKFTSAPRIQVSRRHSLAFLNS